MARPGPQCLTVLSLSSLPFPRELCTGSHAHVSTSWMCEFGLLSLLISVAQSERIHLCGLLVLDAQGRSPAG